MKTSIFLVTILLLSTSVFSQSLQGVATYQTKRNIEISMDSNEVDPSQQQMIQAMLNKQMQKQYQLTFSGYESMYTEKAKLNDPGSSGAMTIMFSGGGILYKNLQTQSYKKESEIFGKKFLIVDSLNNYHWQLQPEKKNIGQFTCYKAMAEINSNDSTVEKRQITAWYAPKITLPHGPGNYWGLPGLIMEINDGSNIIICTEIKFNPDKEVSIVIPDKGKPVDNVAYDAIVKDKLAEMTQRSQQKKGGKSITIKLN